MTKLVLLDEKPDLRLFALYFFPLLVMQVKKKNKQKNKKNKNKQTKKTLTSPSNYLP